MDKKNKKVRNSNKHDSLVQLIEEELLNRGYSQIYKNTVYSKGEIDIYAFKYNYTLVFEAKSNETSKQLSRAKKQLDRVKENLFKDYRTFYFIVSYNKNKPKFHWYRKK